MSDTQNYTFAPKTITLTLEQLVQVELALEDRIEILDGRVAMAISRGDLACEDRNLDRLADARAALALVRA